MVKFTNHMQDQTITQPSIPSARWYIYNMSKATAYNRRALHLNIFLTFAKLLKKGTTAERDEIGYVNLCLLFFK